MSERAMLRPPSIRFGPFELDTRAGELRKHGIRIKLREQPVRVLGLLVENPGELVMREQIRELLWPGDTVVEFDHGINVVLQKLRDALGDSVENPRYVETVARRGYRFIGEIERVAPPLAPTPATPRAVSTDPPPKVPARLQRIRWSWAAAVVLVAALSILATARFLQRPGDSRVIRFNISPPEGNTFGGSPNPLLSPDGQRIVFSTISKDGNRTWLRSLDSPNIVAVPGTEGGSMAFWSPNGKSLAFFAPDRKLKRIDLDGPAGPSHPMALCDARNYAGGAWTDAGVILFSIGSGPLYRVPDTGGEAVPATRLDESRRESLHAYPWFLPDGRHFLFVSGNGARIATNMTVHAGSLDSLETKVVATADSNAIFADGRLIYVRDNTLLAQPFNPGTLATTGDAVPIVSQIEVFSGLGRFSTVSGGPLVYIAGPEHPIEYVWFDRAGRRLAIVADAPPSIDPGYGAAVSPDGREIAISQRQANNSDIWLHDGTRKGGTRLTFDAASDVAPVFSPDGASVAFASDRKGHFDLYRKATRGDQPEELLYTDGEEKFPTGWSPDGRYLLFDRIDDQHSRYSFWALELGTAPAAAVPLREVPGMRPRAVFSPDGRWVAYQSDESGVPEIYVDRFEPQSGARRQISVGGGRFPRWGEDGSEVLYSWGSRLLAVTVKLKTDVIEFGEARDIMPPGSSTIMGFNVSPGGQQFLIKHRSVLAASQPLTVVHNWTAVLK
jgi:eukaryotic-like serine/threonine-protein kinase